MAQDLKNNVILKGVGVSPGIAMGKIFSIDTAKSKLDSCPIKLIDESLISSEVERFNSAVEESKKQLLKIKKRITPASGKDHTYILDAYLMMLEDDFIVDKTVKIIKQKKINAEWALDKSLHKLQNALASSRDEYLRERRRDVNYIKNHILENLTGKSQGAISSYTDEKVIIVAHDLSPAETAQMVKTNIMGFANDVGGKTSHTAIMAKSLKIPAVVGLKKITHVVNMGTFDYIIIDGIDGTVIINPDQETINKYQTKQEKYGLSNKTLLKYSKLPAETKDGFRVKIRANIELIEEVPSVIEYGADGIGLYRTEFLYLNRPKLPTENEHFMAYKEVLEKISPNSATIRTLDIGGDKFLSQLNLAEEMNPVLGLRAVRFCLKEVAIFKIQLRAILKASTYGKLRILFPMISGIEEIRQVKSILEEVKDELNASNTPFDKNIEIGIMIEIPSAVAIADILAREVDFFSIGTNDLIQYSLAIDRVNEQVNYLYNPLHPAVLRLVKNAVDAAHKAGITIAICGEMAGEPMYMPILLGLGLNEFSMDPLSIPRVKKIIRSTTTKESKQLIENILEFSTASEIEKYIKTEFVKRFNDEFPDSSSLPSL